MKFNKWTLGLAALGVVSLAAAARADEKVNYLQTALTGTTISGYVDTSMQWNFGTGNEVVPGYKYNNPNKADGFNLNVIQLSISKPLDESEWAAGYKVDLLFGPDARVYDTSGALSHANANDGAYGEPVQDFAIKQAYVTLRAPVGNGIDLKVGVFDSVVGYESSESGNNPNYTRSYGHTIEPQTETGVLATYRFSDCVVASVGIANTIGPEINERAFGDVSHGGGLEYDRAESYKTYMGSIALTAPKSWGWLADSTLYGGVVNGYNGEFEVDQTSWYAGATIATPVTGLRAGASYDYLGVSKQPLTSSSYYANATAVYLSYQATEKLSLHARGEYYSASDYMWTDPYEGGETVIPRKVVALTGTIQYDLWKNVISRAEFRWDHDASGGREYGYGPSTGGRRNACLVAANVIYKF